MKKWLIAIILIFVSSIGVACGETPSISYAKSHIRVNFDETYTIDTEDIKIENSKNEQNQHSRNASNFAHQIYFNIEEKV